MSYGMHPDDDEYRKLCCKEAEHVVKRLKHHPSILMWCGGNESIMSTDYDFAGEKCLGEEIFLEDFKKICEKLILTGIIMRFHHTAAALPTTQRPGTPMGIRISGLFREQNIPSCFQKTPGFPFRR